MMIRNESLPTLGDLDRADGSATYTANGYQIICAVNGPVEVQRRDELPEEAAIEVNVRPAAGVGGVRERHLESILLSTLRHIIQTTAHPRTLIQITLQIVRSQENGSEVGPIPQATSNIDVLPSLLQAATFALLSASIPLTATLASILLAIDVNGAIMPNPAIKDLSESMSMHALAFSSHSELICAESEGVFNMDQWKAVHERAWQLCLSPAARNSEDVQMSNVVVQNGQVSLQDELRHILQQRHDHENRWKEKLEL